MANILYRASSTATVPTSTTVKNSPLTNLEVDGNFRSVNADILLKAALGANLDITSIGGLTTALTVAQGGTGVKTLTGLVKAAGAANFTAAVVRIDYAEPTNTLGTGILKSTTTTGALTIAVAADFPVLNQSTTGNAATATTATNVAYTGLTGVVPTWNQSTTGNAATATSATSSGDSAKLNGQLPSFYQTALGYTPVRQNGGTGMGTNVIYIGWLGSLLGLQIDNTNFGSVWPIAISGNAASVTNGMYTTGNQTISSVKTFTSAVVSSASDTGFWKTGNIGGSFVSWNGSRSPALQIDSIDNGSAYMIWRATKWGERHLAGMDVYAGGTSATAPTVVMHVGGTTHAFTYSEGGHFTAAGNVTAYSDERLKTDWASMPEDFVARLAEVKCGTYSRIEDGLRQVGVSAQSLQQLMPEAIKVGDDENQTLSVAYGNAALTACVELAAELVALRAEIEILKAK